MLNKTYFLIQLILLFVSSRANEIIQKSLTIVILHESKQNDIPNRFSNIFKQFEIEQRKKGLNNDKQTANYISFNDIYVERLQTDDESNENLEKICQLLSSSSSSNGISLFIDVTWYKWKGLITLLTSMNIPYIHLDLSIKEYLGTLTQYLLARDAIDAVLIFQNERDLDEGIYKLIEDSLLRVVVFNGINQRIAQQIKSVRPIPKYYGVLADTKRMNEILKEAIHWDLMKHPNRWNLQFLDFNSNNNNNNNNILTPEINGNYPEINKLVLTSEMCCHLIGDEKEIRDDCDCSGNFEFMNTFLINALKQITNVLIMNVNQFSGNAIDCKFSDNTTIMEDIIIIDDNKESQLSSVSYLEKLIIDSFQFNPIFKIIDNNKISINVNVSIIVNSKVINYDDGDDDDDVDQFMENIEQHIIGNIENNNIRVHPNQIINSSRRFFRIGITEAIPWVYIERDPITNETLLDEFGAPLWNGYCIELAKQLAKTLNFDYEFVIPKTGTFGKRLQMNKWNGIVGDLMTGEIDLAVAPLKMTAEREEVIDFVAPYFEQTGILIVIRKPVRQTSLFKFMTVLRLEVWLSIVAALTATAIMIWLLDKYSPYSARNNKRAYAYNCRDFSLKESFWFTLTSFTPQGGGEVPKSLSSRTLVAAYWLFVVLMLATFTANLAAFLTVERMQTPVQSLEQLARQSRINYTVVRNSDTHRYFINMKFAEDTLYRVWKEITLNSTSDQSEYRIWDYPIKEQYGHILMAINSSMPVVDASEGFQKVQEHINADYAFIHDAAEIKYEISKNCDLTQVGEIFAEQPYAIGVQQGSQLQDEISRAILELQKNRFLEELTEKYWNHSTKGICPNTDDSEGITLESLGGVFIATLFGLALAMITLIGEVIYYRRKDDGNFQSNISSSNNNNNNNNNSSDLITDVKPFVVANIDDRDWDQTGKQSFIKNVFKKQQQQQPVVKCKKRQIPKNITFGTEFKPSTRMMVNHNATTTTTTTAAANPILQHTKNISYITMFPSEEITPTKKINTEFIN